MIYINTNKILEVVWLKLWHSPSQEGGKQIIQVLHRSSWTSWKVDNHCFSPWFRPPPLKEWLWELCQATFAALLPVFPVPVYKQLSESLQELHLFGKNPFSDSENWIKSKLVAQINQLITNQIHLIGYYFVIFYIVNVSIRSPSLLQGRPVPSILFSSRTFVAIVKIRFWSYKLPVIL